MKKVFKTVVIDNLPILFMSAVGCALAIKGVQWYDNRAVTALSTKPSTGTIVPATTIIE